MSGPPDPVRRRSLPAALLAALRPRQWIKNLFLFAGLLFTLDRPHPAHDFWRAGAGFLLFSMLAGVVYLVNDLADQESDRRHPRKRLRPIASGELSPTIAVIAAVILVIVALVSSFWLGVGFGAVALTYFLLTLGYTFYFKHVVLMDVIVLALCYVLRAIAGAVVIGVDISSWLILCTLMLALFLGLSKRRAEIIATQQAGAIGTRRILQEYSEEMLDQMIVIVTSGCLMSYSLYTITSESAGRHPYLMLTIPFVIYGIFRYLYLVHRRGLGESPDAALTEDRPTLANVILWAVTTGLIITHTLSRLAPHLMR